MMRPALPKKRARAEERLASPPGTADVWARWTADGAAHRPPGRAVLEVRALDTRTGQDAGGDAAEVASGDVARLSAALPPA